MTEHDEKTMSLADQIRQAAKDSGLSVNRMAKDARVNQSLLNRFLNRTQENLRLDIADKLCRFLGLRLVRRRGRPQKPPGTPRQHSPSKHDDEG